MDERSTLDLLYVAAFFIGGLGFGVGPFIIATLMAPRGTRNISQKTNQLIECGVPPIGDAWIRYSANYYLYALIFLAFDVDVLFLFPVAMAYNQTYEIRDFVEVLLFVGILSLALVYAWKKGVFEWKRKNYNRQ
nr:NADH-quinone oxidoreductase subunit A [Desulfobulbaceae bacterium]